MKHRMYPFFFLLGFLMQGCNTEPSNPVADVAVEEAIGAIEEGLLPAIMINGDESAGMSLEERMSFFNVAGVSIAVLKDGEIQWAKGYGVADSVQGNMVDTNTIFQAGSISKPVAALAALHLVQEGKMDMDEPINNYLSSWKIPEHEWSASNPVTLRHLLTHTGGLTVHGFPGYTYQDTFPEINQVLDGEGNTGAIFVDTEPGTNWRYSGGGYTIMEKAVEDVSGMPLEDYTRQYVLDPLGMTKSTYAQPLPESWHAQASAAYDSEGHYYEGGWHNYPEQAAAGLWTTPRDLLRYVQGMQRAYAGESSAVIDQATAQAMLTKHENNWGLGPSLSGGEGDSLVFGHGGKNAGFSNNLMAFAKKGGDGIIVMTNSDQGTSLMQEIIRGASAYYDWGIVEPRRIDTVHIAAPSKPDYTGSYVYKGEMPQLQDYKVTLKWEEHLLIIEDPQSGENNEMWATSDTEFVDKNNGVRAAFVLAEAGNTTEFTFNGTYTFVKSE